MGKGLRDAPGARLVTNLRRRDPLLLVTILGHVYESPDPVPWAELVETYTDDQHPWKTTENLLYDLVSYGALHRIGKPSGKGRRDTRALKATDLGRAWLARELLPLPTDQADGTDLYDEIGEENLDALEIHELGNPHPVNRVSAFPTTKEAEGEEPTP